uniref:Uncharacterized protein n=1 Tax=Ditylum brightwellii TaxID=49249 RepID=A0A7S4T0S5_9STRA
MIEHMAHLTSSDYEEIPRDLLLLGFIPEDKADSIGDSGIVEVLADIYGAWTKGGGAAAINVNKVISQLQDLTAEKGNLFQIPPYFAYIAKSFSVLEGIGLSNDEKYSIINECLPYVSKRLLTDKADRMGGALSTFIFGPDKYNTDTRIVDYDRVEQLVTGFGDYQTSASGALLGQEDTTRLDLIENLSDQILDLVVTEEETPLQTIFIEQLAKMISSSSRSVWADLREASGTLPSGRSVLGTIVDPLGLFRTSPIVRMNDLDIKTVETTRSLLELMSSQLSKSDQSFDLSTLTNVEVQNLSRMLVRKIWDRRRGVFQTSNRLATMMLKLTADKLESGERDVLVLPRPGEDKVETEEGKKNDLTVSDGRIHNKDAGRDSSERLSRARSILSELKELEDTPGGVEDHQVVDLLNSKESSSSRPMAKAPVDAEIEVESFVDLDMKEESTEVSKGSPEKEEIVLQR